MRKRITAAILLLAAIASFLLFAISFAGHPPYVGIGIAILPVSLGASVAFMWAAFRVLQPGAPPRD